MFGEDWNPGPPPDCPPESPKRLYRACRGGYDEKCRGGEVGMYLGTFIGRVRTREAEDERHPLRRRCGGVARKVRDSRGSIARCVVVDKTERIYSVS